MSISGSLQNRINPHTARNISQSFNDRPVNDVTANQLNPELQTDFKDLLNNSMDQIRREREAKKYGDLTASSEDEFFERLADQTKQQVEAKNEMTKDDFLKLFVAQLQHQDPLNPDNGAEMATKLAQFNSLEQMMNMNQTLDKMVNSQNIDRNLQMVGYVGKEVSLQGGRIKLDGDSISESSYQISRPASKASIEIRDSSGSLVYEREIGPLEAGEHELKWDGRDSTGSSLPNGVYNYQIYARDIEGENIAVAITSKARITGIDIKSEDGTLYSDFGKIGFDDVISVGEPGFSEAAKKKGKSQPEQANANLSQEIDAGHNNPKTTAFKEFENLQTDGHVSQNVNNTAGPQQMALGR